MNLTQKEKFLLNDLKSHEELCIKKYNSYIGQAKDPQLKQVFSKNVQQEQQHLNTINTILSGQVPDMKQQAQQGGQMQQNQGMQNQAPMQGLNTQNDKDLCTDILDTEKYVSSTYNTSIFEFSDHTLREALNHIQKEEQQHGEDVFNYMKSKGMYNVQ